MTIRSLASQHQQLKWLVQQAAQFRDLELQAHWARYLCVLSAGFLENALSEVYTKYAKRCANPSVANYVSSKLARIQNPKHQLFLETAGSFSKTWKKELQEFLLSDGRSAAIDAIMTNRHLVAHGKDSDISIVRVREYLAKSVDVVQFIAVQCDVVVL